MEASTAPTAGAAAAATAPPPATPTPDAAAEAAAEGGLVLDAAIYEPPAERLRNYQQVRTPLNVLVDAVRIDRSIEWIKA